MNQEQLDWCTNHLVSFRENLIDDYILVFYNNSGREAQVAGKDFYECVCTAITTTNKEVK